MPLRSKIAGEPCADIPRGCRHPDGARPFEEYAVDQRVGLDGQVVTTARWIDPGERRSPAHAVLGEVDGMDDRVVPACVRKCGDER
jgi:hypothetical protein